MTGEPRSTCDDMPDPWPMAAACFAFLLKASVTSGRRNCADWSPAMLPAGGPAGASQARGIEASGLPLVAIETSPLSVSRRTLTVAVRPSA